MNETALGRGWTGSGSLLRLAVVSLVSAVVFAFAAADSSAQITPQPGANDYCADASPAGLRTTPVRTSVNVAVTGSGSVAARMFGTQAEGCFVGTTSPTCATSCTWQVMRVCEFHCQHNHTPPYAWKVELIPVANAGSYFRGWSGSCVPVKTAARASCIVETYPTPTATARFGASPDASPPTAPVLTGSPAPYAANLSWSSSSDDEWLGGYDIFKGTAASPAARVGPGATTYRVSNLACGETYTFRVVAYDSRSETESNTVSVKTAACAVAAPPRPNTVIHVKPPKVTRSRTAFFHYGFTGTVRATKYQCKLDRGRWVACSGSKGKTYRRLKRSYHTFYVRAGNAAGFDRTPAKYRWRIR